VVFVVRKEFEMDFHRQVGAGFAAPQGGPPKPWGTGHAVLAAKGAVKGPFMAINADDFYGRRSFAVLADWLAGPAPRGGPEGYALVAFGLANTLSPSGAVSRGICEVGADGELASVRERAALEAHGGGARAALPDGSFEAFTGAEPVSMNLWGFGPGVFDLLEDLFARFLADRGRGPEAEFYIPGAVDSMIRSGRARVQVLRTPERWFGMTHRGDRGRVASRISELVGLGEYPPSLWGGG